jgi:sec-independent protein translocase protein TatB
MNLFGVGPLELIVILAVALIFVGPERLPRLAADLARTIREIRKYTGALSTEFNAYVKEVEKETVGERSEWKQIGDGIGAATQSVTDALRSARTSAEATPGKAAPAPSPEGEWREIADPVPSPPATNGAAHDGAPVHSNGAAPSPAAAAERP